MALCLVVFALSGTLAITATDSAAQGAPADGPTLAPFASGHGGAVQPPWQFEGLPEQYQRAPTHFSFETDHGAAVLRVTTDNSYGTIAHPWHGPAPGSLVWRWRLDQPLTQSDVATKDGDDSALKVCVMFDQPLNQMPFFERTALRLARATSGKPLPAATLCYLWDSKYPTGTPGRNPYTDRVRYIVLRGPTAPLAKWADEQRDTSADFQRLFGDESPRTPGITAVVVGADSDNTHGASVGYVAVLHWAR